MTVARGFRPDFRPEPQKARGPDHYDVEHTVKEITAKGESKALPGRCGRCFAPLKAGRCPFCQPME